MKKSRFSAEQIVAILNEAAAKETKLAEICRKHGITEQTVYRLCVLPIMSHFFSIFCRS